MFIRLTLGLAHSESYNQMNLRGDVRKQTIIYGFYFVTYYLLVNKFNQIIQFNIYFYFS